MCRRAAEQGLDPRNVFMRRVVVTGMGMVTPLGPDLNSTWSALLAGRSGVGPIGLFDARTFPTRIAAEVKDFRLDDYLQDSGRWTEHSRNTQFALAAGKGSGFLRSHPAQRWARQAMFFLVWSCPAPALDATLACMALPE
jgi:hypothetical protein